MKALLEIKEGQEPLYNIQLNKSEAGDVIIPIFAFLFGTDSVGMMMAKLYLAQSDPEQLRKMTNDIKRQQNIQGAYLDFVEQLCLMRLQHQQQRPDDFKKKPTTEQATPATSIDVSHQDGIIRFYRTETPSFMGTLVGYVAKLNGKTVGYRAITGVWITSDNRFNPVEEVTEEQANEGADKPFAEFYAQYNS